MKRRRSRRSPGRSASLRLSGRSASRLPLIRRHEEGSGSFLARLASLFPHDQPPGAVRALLDSPISPAATGCSPPRIASTVPADFQRAAARLRTCNHLDFQRFLARQVEFCRTGRQNQEPAAESGCPESRKTGRNVRIGTVFLRPRDPQEAGTVSDTMKTHLISASYHLGTRIALLPFRGTAARRAQPDTTNHSTGKE
jgi:hypothetical protein